MSAESDLPDEWLSARFDGESAESASNARLTDEERTLAEWQQLGDSLRAIPTAECDLSVQVLAEIRTLPDNSEKRRSSGLQWVAVVTSLAATVLVGINMYLESQLPQSLASVARVQEWEVLVVHVPETELPSDFSRHLDEHGFQIRNLTEAEPAAPVSGADQIDFVLTSEEMSAHLLESLEDEFGMTTERNPSNIGSLTREELLSRCAESLTSATRSDQHFGNISLLVSDEQIAENGDVQRSVEMRLAEYVASGKRRPVVVVVVRDKSAQVPQLNWLRATPLQNRS